ncbi:MAG: phosphoglucosamine mutase [Actinobacteria bacterium]|nr:phosphoglucosamine mutase [Actinomycetota bacterium]
MKKEAILTRSFFGTDGIRGIANDVLSAELAMAVGRAAVAVLPAASPRILIGRDTRISGPMLESALIAGISSAGGISIRAGVIPTPALASLVLAEGADAGAVISASHNPYRDNGIKFFGSSGFKLSDAQELEMEQFLSGEISFPPPPTDPGPVLRLADPVEEYVEKLLRRFDLDLSGMRLLVDCAQGATYRSTPMALKRLGADVTVICDEPDGLNINAGCGSTHIELLQEAIRNGGYDAGLAHDGDGDRVIAVDAEGGVVDGDFILAICGSYLKEAGRLPHDTIVTTVMTNLGFHLAMKELGIKVVTADVGDRYVLEEMLAGGFGLGGEQSGHIINLEAGTTGDGLATTLLLLSVMRATGRPLKELALVMKRLPQRLVNIQVGDREALNEAAKVWSRVEAEESRLGDEGRVLVRPSGTEPVVRVMVEAATVEVCDEVCDNIARVIRKEMG